jgi:hypothetical protein
MRAVTAVDPAAHGFWSFPVDDIALSGAVVFYCAGLWLLCNHQGRRHVQSGAWLPPAASSASSEPGSA